jgi:hypothetical protein
MRSAGLACAFVALSLASLSQPQSGPDTEQQRINAWRRTRVAELTADDGWLTVVGLHWLHDGVNYAGSAAGTDLPLPREAPAMLGEFTLKDGRVRFTAAKEVVVTVGGVPFDAGDVALDKTVLEAGSLRMLVIQRGARIGLRVRDLASPARQAFKGIEYFPIDESTRVQARFEPFTPPKEVPIVNVLGDVIDTPSPGRLVFRLGGAEYALDTIVDEPDAPDLFVIFRDRTNGDTTYPAGRYLHVPLPVNGMTTIDFNQAYNPPCAFTEFATCPLPPKQNWLKTSIEAGERRYGAH